jgi:hypothetical protein
MSATDATILAAKRCPPLEVIMHKQRSVETPEDRDERRTRDAEMKRDEAAANDVAIDRMIKRNIEQYGP